MEIKKAQNLVYKHLVKIGYTKSETTPVHAFLHLIEEIGEVSRALLHKETKRGKFANSTDPGIIEDEVADIFWQTLKLASYLKIDLNKAFVDKLKKNRNKSKML
ncbi:MAG: MazG nucleotide pyrophosphohydrolase domain-containing protein [Patescibacteria group bacterium]